MKKLFYPIFSNIEILKGKDTQRVLYTKTKVFARVTFCALQGKYPLTLFRLSLFREHGQLSVSQVPHKKAEPIP